MNPIFEKEWKMHVRAVKFPIMLALFDLILYLISMWFLLFAADIFRKGSNINYLAMNTLFFVIFLFQSCVSYFITSIFMSNSICNDLNTDPHFSIMHSHYPIYKTMFGKMESAGGIIFLFHLSNLPMLCIAALYGGISAKEMLYYGGILLLLTLYSSVLGMFFSVLTRKRYLAIMGSLLYETALTAGILGIACGVTYILDGNSAVGTASGMFATKMVSLSFYFNPFILLYWFYDYVSGGINLWGFFEYEMNLDVQGQFFDFLKNTLIPGVAIGMIVRTVILFSLSCMMLDKMAKKGKFLFPGEK